MRLTLFSFFLLIANCCFSQKCFDTTESGELVNCIDINGQKQGKWIYYNTKLRHSYEIEDTTNSELAEYRYYKQKEDSAKYQGCKQDRFSKSIVIYHPEGIVEQSWDDIFFVKRRMIFKGDKILLLEGRTYQYYYFKIPLNDSKFHFKIDTTDISSLKKIEIKVSENKFYFQYMSKNILEETFQNLDMLNFELDRLEIGFYEGKINRLF
ncbi:hypothetical protein HZR84_09975 [Hyphobacterium sp. CCMP332]|nr:hypothetical protein HZR84_09975 [Hyphobacterium sp. CCMP332]